MPCGGAGRFCALARQKRVLPAIPILNAAASTVAARLAV
jgi:hypothetical protein